MVDGVEISPTIKLFGSEVSFRYGKTLAMQSGSRFIVE